MTERRNEAIHVGIVCVALLALVVVVALAATYARDELDIVLYSSVYVAGICTFWLGYWFLKTRSEGRRERLLER